MSTTEATIEPKLTKVKAKQVVLSFAPEDHARVVKIAGKRKVSIAKLCLLAVLDSISEPKTIAQNELNSEIASDKKRSIAKDTFEPKIDILTNLEKALNSAQNQGNPISSPVLVQIPQVAQAPIPSPQGLPIPSPFVSIVPAQSKSVLPSPVNPSQSGKQCQAFGCRSKDARETPIRQGKGRAWLCEKHSILT